MLLQQPIYKRVLSYLYPIRVAKISTSINKTIELLLYHNRFQLATDDALYSDGDRYRPLLMAFDTIGKELGSISNVLMLGGGLCSGAHILAKRGYYPEILMVEHDDAVIQWAIAIAAMNKKIRLKSKCIDAQEFVKQHSGVQYNLLICDIFNSRVVPEFVTTAIFLEHCKLLLAPGGYFVLNYIVNKQPEWEAFQQTLNSTFPQCRILSNSINKIVVAKV
jgi:predicted membrane-bound spermidine synthase